MSGFGNNNWGNNPFGSPPPAQPPQQSFGTPAPGNPFGSSAPQQPFGSAAPAPQQPFVAAPPAFGTPDPPFGQPSAAPASSITFGTSSSIAQAPSAPSAGFGNSTGFNSTTAGFGSSNNTTTAQSFSSNNPFGAPSNPPPAQTFGAPAPPPPQITNNPFGLSSAGATTTNFGTSSNLAMDDAMNSRSNTNSPMETPKLTPFGQPAATTWTNNNNNTRPAADEEAAAKLAKLKAKLEEKKKRMAEKKAKALNAEAPAFVPTTVAATNSKDTEDPAKQTLVERNALRFHQSQKKSTSNYMPRNLETAAAPAARPGRTNLASAVSLVGTCPYMCPDEELERRERESDIQLLERPHEQLHPPSWTYRDTVIKRFRRSAADYKLDVPEWVRPPDMLERVCAYLEEWIMEKDRQGPDPRFPGNGVPNSLDVYQFIWDRTRMVRKDFTLQNYVGTGGQCDARAVRCHERIARWHALCEHQLSHLPLYARNQSQQNIQELGQTMKTLNQFYDDSLKRHLVEVPDENGSETRTDASKHGCESDVVQGVAPVDYNEAPLLNDDIRASRRCIGATTANHGTAEAEMRGMYILLTIDNDGGMEVLKYAGRLFSERRDLYDSEYVQLAMSVYKAKRELNYARFFALLRAPTTPYLYCCIMFKHVRFMREIAFQIMAKTYGGVSRETRESIYDQYPLKELARLLCFEDMDEARSACKHYGITAKEMKIKTSNKTVEIIFWKKSQFKIPKDPEKGTVITLRPRKMLRTVEAKVQGATRLAICRGEVSTLNPATGSVQPIPSAIPNAAPPPPQPVPTQPKQSQGAAIEAIKNKEKERLELAAKQQKEQEEVKKREEEARRLEEEKQAKAKAEEERQRTLAAEQEMQRRKQEEELRLKLKRQEEEMQQLRMQAEQEAARKKAEEEAKRKRLEEERLKLIALEEQKRREEEALRKRQEEEDRRRRAAEELARARALELQREREEAARRAQVENQIAQVRKEKEEKARLEAESWLEEVIDAKRQLFLLRCQDRIPVTTAVSNDIRATLNRVDHFSGSLLSVVTQRGKGESLSPWRKDVRSCIESLLKRKPDFDLSQRMAESMLKQIVSSRGGRSKARVWLVTVGVFLPRSTDLAVQSYSSIMYSFLKDVLHTDRVHTAAEEGVEVRLTFKVSLGENVPCDMCLFALPPAYFPASRTAALDLSVMASLVPHSIPRVILALIEDYQPSTLDKIGRLLANTLSDHSSKPAFISNSGVGEEEVMESLYVASDRLVEALRTASLQVIRRISPEEVVCRCIVDGLQTHTGVVEQRDEVTALTDFVLRNVQEEFAKQSSRSLTGLTWPDRMFFEGRDQIQNYFLAEGLPYNWEDLSSPQALSGGLKTISRVLSMPIQSSIRDLVRHAPARTRDKCHILFEARRYNECLRASLQWRMVSLEPWEQETFLYMEDDKLQKLYESVADNLGKEMTSYHEISYTPVRQLPGIAASNHLALRSPGLSQSDKEDQRERTNFSEPRVLMGQTPKRRLEETPPPVQSAQKPMSPVRGSQSSTKRRRRSSKERLIPPVSRLVADSMDFTSRLEALAAGDIAQDLLVGNITLTALIRSPSSSPQ